MGAFEAGSIVQVIDRSPQFDKLSSTDLLVLVALFSRTKVKEGQPPTATVSHQTLARQCRRGRSTVQLSLGRLEAAGAITCVHRGDQRKPSSATLHPLLTHAGCPSSRDETGDGTDAEQAGTSLTMTPVEDADEVNDEVDEVSTSPTVGPDMPDSEASHASPRSQTGITVMHLSSEQSRSAVQNCASEDGSPTGAGASADARTGPSESPSLNDGDATTATVEKTRPAGAPRTFGPPPGIKPRVLDPEEAPS